jgi:hypothetical protein
LKKYVSIILILILEYIMNVINDTSNIRAILILCFIVFLILILYGYDRLGNLFIPLLILLTIVMLYIRLFVYDNSSNVKKFIEKIGL